MSMTAAILLIYAACLAGAIASPPSSGPRTGQAPARRPPAALLALALLAALAPPLPARAGEAAPRPVAGPATIIDGATLEIGGRRLRLYGIDAPDLGQTCFDARERDYPCGRAAARALAARIGGGTVACEPRGTAALCRLDGDDLAAWMVEGGYAIADRSVTTAYAAEDERAWGRRLGLWSGVFQDPAEWRRGRAVSMAGLKDLAGL